jgi:putative nucleotidyltransferase with HDIG domain
VTNRFVLLPRRAQAFLSAVTLFGLLGISHSVYTLYSKPVPAQWFLLAALTLLSGSVTIRLPSIPATISVSETFVFTSVLLFGTASGTIIVTLDGLIISLWLQRRNLEFYKLLFNTTAPALSIWISAQLFFWVTGAAPLSVHPTSISSLLPGLLLFAVTYFLLNSWLMAVAVSFEKLLTPMEVWLENFLWLSLSFLSGASAAILLVSLNREVNLSALAVIVPLLVISYLTYHTSLGRVEDANKHVDKMNRLYLSTIETLALAIDAKDQVTHGHIRRVQAYSVRLARQLGVNDENLIMAIEAASLLHDMGKLAIPEHILNKPGKLTPAEFDIMKLHASVGADILAAVDFPYPVVPIVRHHHENWDGSGYPDRLSGTEIPIGARILSVVDCFDALTSDRPYRAKLSDEKAIDILESRRAVMYDPLVVDAFLEMHDNIALPADYLPQDTIALTARLTLGTELAVPRPVPASGNHADFGESNGYKVPYGVEVVGSYISRILPGSMVVLYTVSESRAALHVARAWGKGAGCVKRVAIPFGGRLSGLVASTNRRMAADASLDLSVEDDVDSARFGRCSSIPIDTDKGVLAVLSIYFPAPFRPSATQQLSLAAVEGHLSAFSPKYREG